MTKAPRPEPKPISLREAARIARRERAFSAISPADDPLEARHEDRRAASEQAAALEVMLAASRRGRTVK